MRTVCAERVCAGNPQEAFHAVSGGYCWNSGNNRGGKLTLLLAALSLAVAARPAHAQKSPPCGSLPCVEIGLMNYEGFDYANFEDDDAHFIYAPAGQPVEVDVLAKFYSGENCSMCTHVLPEDPEDPEGYVEPLVIGSRVWEWKVTGATSYEFKSHSSASWKRHATIALQEAGDVITISARVGPTAPGECDDDPWGNYGTHGGTHAGKEATTTIKLWRLDMEVTGGNAEQNVLYPFKYKTTFASSVTTQATLIGASPASTNPWEWSSAELMDFQQLNTMSGSSSWSGIVVAPTGIQTIARVVNGCHPTSTSTGYGLTIIEPLERRPGWDNMAVTHSGEDNNWLATEPNAFPILGEEFIAWAQNTNTVEPYDEYNQVIVTPVYSGDAVEPEHFADFDGVREVIPSGPNYTLWYLTDPSLFKVARKSLINHWITPEAQKPGTVPALGPQGISYTNWSDIYTVMGTDTCACSDPSSHGGVGSDIRYRANVWHEGFGCPGSSNQEELGHQIRIENAVNNGDKNLYDAVWRSDLQWAKSLPDIKSAAESARLTASNKLKEETLDLHIFVTNEPQKHNFRGIMWKTDGTTWETDGTVSTY